MLQDPTRSRVVVGCGSSYNLALSIAAALNLKRFPAIAVPAGEWLIRPQGLQRRDRGTGSCPVAQR